ncbi:MAG: site-specific integrase, partial [Rhodocyclaceae bacterium]|nr:site-specific integrase [Rhodocyclaceae bacterium]
GGENTAALRRRQRWIEQQNEALFWIERFLVSKPMPGDPLPAWLEGSAVDRLQAQGIQTLQQLKDFIERHGKTWYRHIEGVGPVVADRIVQWLLEHTHDLGHLGDTAVVGRNVVARSGLPSVAQRLLRRQDAPAVPATLQEAAQQQLPACLIRARDDWHTIQAWIQARAGSAHTARAYRKEAERFLLFLQQEKGCGLRQLKTEDLNDYKTFLALLGRGAAWPFRVPEHQYLAPRNIARADARWRPFEGALSARSAQHALVIVRAWLEFLVQVRYLPANPAAGINIRAAADDQRTQVRGLSRAQYDLVRECAQRYADDHEGDRLRFLLALAYHSAAR